VPRPQACLVDVYETILSCDFAAFRRQLPVLAGIPADTWQAGYRRIDDELSTGRLSKSEGFARIMTECGVEPRPALVRALVDKDRELLHAAARLFDDAIPFLERLRSRGIKIAIVSNCDEQARGLLGWLGVTPLADALILSCEVGAAKPSARIYQRALQALGVTAEAALFVDDNPEFCAQAAALGIRTAQIVRGEPAADAPAAGITLVRSLSDVEAMLPA
jgi:putative hydrolase of the HAD superfamily